MSSFKKKVEIWTVFGGRTPSVTYLSYVVGKLDVLPDFYVVFLKKGRDLDCFWRENPVTYLS
jgi:hypothetical protein